jgi:hypothetical protein
MRVSRQDELLDAERRVLLDPLGHLLVTAHQSGAGAAADQARTCSQVRTPVVRSALSSALIDMAVRPAGAAARPAGRPAPVQP